MAQKIKVTISENGLKKSETETELNEANCREFTNVLVTLDGKPVKVTSAVFENHWKNYKKQTTKLFLTDSIVEALKQVGTNNVSITIETTEE